MENENILEKIKEADMVLVGLGEDFDNTKYLQQREMYRKGKALLQEAGYHWLIPMWMEHCSPDLEENKVTHALKKLEQLLCDKNYFIVSVATNSKITQIPWKKDRIVMPCGNILRKQCVKGCADALEDVTEEDRAGLREVAEALAKDSFSESGIPDLGKCSRCGGDMVLNTIYAENYDESGYLKAWEFYTKWLQGTLNHKLLILELGVSLRFPSVIRWPFEKVAFFNNKAFFCRVNEKLYQLTEELAVKGIGISQNAIDWIGHL